MSSPSGTKCCSQATEGKYRVGTKFCLISAALYRARKATAVGCTSWVKILKGERYVVWQKEGKTSPGRRSSLIAGELGRREQNW